MHLWVFFYSNSCCSVFKPVSFIFGPKCIFSHCTLLDVDMPSKKSKYCVLKQEKMVFFCSSPGWCWCNSNCSLLCVCVESGASVELALLPVSALQPSPYLLALVLHDLPHTAAPVAKPPSRGRAGQLAQLSFLSDQRRKLVIRVEMSPWSFFLLKNSIKS